MAGGEKSSSAKELSTLWDDTTFSHIFKCMRNKRIIQSRLLLHLDPVWFVFLALTFFFFYNIIFTEKKEKGVIMFEKVNPSHPDKIADRIAGALVDYAYTQQENPKIAVEVLIGHGDCSIITETSVPITLDICKPIVDRIAGINYSIYLRNVPQDIHLSINQKNGLKCGDNGIFKGCELLPEEQELTQIAKEIYDEFPMDGKYILNKNRLIICQSYINQNIDVPLLQEKYNKLGYEVIINPLGYWTGGPDVDAGATNRKLGSDMGSSVTGGGLHGKDLSKADVSINIFCWLMAQEFHQDIECCCAIGDEKIGIFTYKEIVDIARNYINKIGGFEKFAEWGLIRP